MRWIGIELNQEVNGERKVVKRHKSIGLRIILGIAAIACGLAVQVFGALLDKVLASVFLASDRFFNI